MVVALESSVNDSSWRFVEMDETAKCRRGDSSFASVIVGWWSKHGRDFPWRQTSDPFRILVAEILLQRSRSGTVASVYSQLFQRWSTPRELAVSDMAELEHLISPLGLKSRATSIKAAAIGWSERKKPPDTAEELQELNGVGAYSANATAIAMSWNADPCVDSVSIRVLRRYLDDKNDGLTDIQVASRAYSLVSKDQWRELNWAILDLAAAVCMPRRPRCPNCPLEDRCKWARKQGQKRI